MANVDHPCILAIGTAVPQNEILQREAAAWTARAFKDDPLTVKFVQKIYEHSGIQKRYSVLPDFNQPPIESNLSPGLPKERARATSTRLQTYADEAPRLGVQAGRRALLEHSKRTRQDLSEITSQVSDLVVVSCTGFYAPGLDLDVARELGLRPDVQRSILGFMGCAAAFNALRLARDAVSSRPEALVLVLCVELCSLHIQPSCERESLVAASIFGDGAAACLVGSGRPQQAPSIELCDFHTHYEPQTESSMVWRIGDHGFDLNLSPRIPETLERIVAELLQGREIDSPDFWVIHPGGQAILERLQKVLDLEARELACSWEVLRSVGNLSSATIFFVLQETLRTLRQTHSKDSKGVAMAFGPGLVVELAQLRFVESATI